MLALALAVLAAIRFSGKFSRVVLWLRPAGYIPLGYVRSGGDESLVKNSVGWLLLMCKNIFETRKQVGEVDVVTELDLPVHI